MPEAITPGSQDMGFSNAAPQPAASPEAEPQLIDGNERKAAVPKGAEAWFGVEGKTTEEFMDVFRQDGMVLVHETRAPEKIMASGQLLPRYSLNIQEGLKEHHKKEEDRHPSKATHFSCNRTYNFDVQDFVESDPGSYYDQLKYVYDNSGKMTGFFAHPGVLATNHEISKNLLIGWSGEPHQESVIEDVAVRGSSEDSASEEHAINLDSTVFFAPKNILVNGRGELVRRVYDSKGERVATDGLGRLAEGKEVLTRIEGSKDEPIYEYRGSKYVVNVVNKEVRTKRQEDPDYIVMRSEDYWKMVFQKMEDAGQKPPKHVFFYDGLSRKTALKQFRDQNGVPEPDARKFYEDFRGLDPEVVRHKDERWDRGHGAGYGEFFQARSKPTAN